MIPNVPEIKAEGSKSYRSFTVTHQAHRPAVGRAARYHGNGVHAGIFHVGAGTPGANPQSRPVA